MLYLYPDQVKIKIVMTDNPNKPRRPICLKRFSFRRYRVDRIVNLICSHSLLLYPWMIRNQYLLWKTNIMSGTLWLGSRLQLTINTELRSLPSEIVAEPYFKVPFRTRYRWCALHYWRGNNFKRMCVFRYVGLSASPPPPHHNHHPQTTTQGNSI